MMKDIFTTPVFFFFFFPHSASINNALNKANTSPRGYKSRKQLNYRTRELWEQAQWIFYSNTRTNLSFICWYGGKYIIQ